MSTAADWNVKPIIIHGLSYIDRGFCYAVDNVLDGLCVHTATCREFGTWAASASGPNSTCVKQGQNGAALKREREAKANEVRFTPPEYRLEGHRASPRRQPGPVITAAQGQQTEVLALRGRPRTPPGSPEAEWSTWETFTRIDPAYVDQPMVSWMHKIPAEMTNEQAEAIVAEFAARILHYEFQIVRARLVIKEERLA